MQLKIKGKNQSYDGTYMNLYYQGLAFTSRFRDYRTSVGKYFADGLKPYKTKYQITMGFLQPVRGVKNIGKGLVDLIVLPGCFLMDLLLTCRYSGSLKSFAKNTGQSFVQAVSLFLAGVSYLVLGVTQIVTTPITWLIKTPLRVLISLIKDVPKIEQNRGIQDLVTSFEKKPTSYTISQLHWKFEKAAMKRGQRTGIKDKDENMLYEACDRADRDLYEGSYDHESRKAKEGALKEAQNRYIALFRKGAEVAEPQQDKNPSAKLDKF